MKQQNLDETRYMRPDEVKRFQQKNTSTLEDTQSLPPHDEAEGIQQPFPQQAGRVRELAPNPAPAEEKERTHRFFPVKRKKLLLLFGGFFLAVLLGFAAAGYHQDSVDKEQDLRLRQEQLADREKKLDGQESDLQKRRQEVEAQKRSLEERQQELERQAERIQGKADALADEKPSSAIGKLIDKVSGKAGKREQATAEAKEQGAATASEAESVHRSIADAQTVLNELDKKIDTVHAMKQDVDKVKAQAQSAYAENRDVIDRAVAYAKKGMALLEAYLSQ